MRGSYWCSVVIAAQNKGMAEPVRICRYYNHLALWACPVKMAVLYEYLMAPVKKNRKNHKNAYFLCKLWLNNH